MVNELTCIITCFVAGYFNAFLSFLIYTSLIIAHIAYFMSGSRVGHGGLEPPTPVKSQVLKVSIGISIGSLLIGFHRKKHLDPLP